MENEVRNALPLSGHPFPDVDFEAPIRGLPNKSCDLFWEAFGLAAKNAGDNPEGFLFQSVWALCRFMPNYLDRGEPYRPILTTGEYRSSTPGDLTPADLDIVSQLYERSQEPALRARLGDLLFLRKRDHKAALDAANNYVAAANALLTESGWLYARELYRRGLQLAAALGQEKDTFKRAADALLAALQNPLAQTQPFFACYLLKIAIGMGIGDAATLAQIAKMHADQATAAKEFRRAREYRILQADFLHLAKQLADENTARLQVAETYVEEGEQALQRPEPSHIVAAKFLSQGVEALRQAKGDPSRISELRERLRQYQAKSMDEMQSFEYEIDLYDMAETAMEFVRVPDFRDAIERLALGHSITDIKKLREEVIEGAKEAPLMHLMGADIVNQHGQVQKSTGPLIGAVGDAAEKEMESRMFQAAARSHWIVRAHGFIVPARVQIWKDHPVMLADFDYLARHNPFIPPGHEGIFMRGLFYGLAGDTMLAVHLLVPQIENSIRHMLHCNGIDVSNLNSDLTQPVKLLGPLMDMPETKKLLGEDLMFEVRGLLIEKTGFSFRNNLAHGFITEWESNAESAVNCWWLVLRMCVMTHKMLNKEQSGDQGSTK